MPPWATICNKDLNAAILIFGGPSDRALGQTISGMMAAPAIDLSGRTSLGEAMALIDRCDGFRYQRFGTHACGRRAEHPLVAIFGSTNSTTTSPYSNDQPDRSRTHRMQPLHAAGLPVGPHELHEMGKRGNGVSVR
jgi:ADP-heptose:LPS heptosyltransferase